MRVRLNTQVQILHAELDEEEVPEGFTLGLSNGASETSNDEQAGGGKKRAADEVLATRRSRVSEPPFLIGLLRIKCVCRPRMRASVYGRLRESPV